MTAPACEFCGAVLTIEDHAICEECLARERARWPDVYAQVAAHPKIHEEQEVLIALFTLKNPEQYGVQMVEWARSVINRYIEQS